MMSSTLHTTDRLYELCKKRLGVLQQLREMTINQMERVASGDTDGLLTMLSRKQYLLDEIQRIQLELEPYQGQEPEGRIWKRAEDRIECRRMVEEGQQILRDLLSLEGNSIDILSQHRDSVANELKLNHSASTVRSAYDSHEVFQSEIFSSGLESSPLSLEG